MVFERFIELIFPRDGEALFDKNILYIPGNHDHHIWENGRETKPFSQNMNFSGFTPWMKVFNSGGWVVDSVKPSPIHGGVVILIDEALHATSLRMYNEAASVEGL